MQFRKTDVLVDGIHVLSDREPHAREGLPTETTIRAGACEFRMHLSMTGPLASLILKSVGNRQPEIDSFTAALKARAEETAAR